MLSAWRSTLVSALMAFAALTANAQDLVLGQIGPFTGIPVPDALEVNQGIRAYLALVNNRGGIGGEHIKFFQADDRYNAAEFLKQLDLAVARKPLALLSPIGSAALTRMLDEQVLDSGRTIIVNAIPGAESLRNPGHPNLFHIRAGDRRQIHRIISHVSTLGMDRVALLYQDLPIGKSGLVIAKEEVAGIPGMELFAVQATSDPASLGAAAVEIAKLKSKAVLVIGGPPFMAAGVSSLRKAGVNQAIFVLSYAQQELIVKLAGAEGARGVGIAQTFPNPNGATLPLHREFQATMKASFPDMRVFTPFQLEGYLTARAVVEAIRRSKEKVTSPAALARALRQMGEIDMGGFRVDFSRSNSGSQFVDIAVIGGEGRLRY